MAPFSRLIRFESGGKTYFSDLGVDTIEPPPLGTPIKAYQSLDDLISSNNDSSVALGKVGYPTKSSRSLRIAWLILPRYDNSSWHQYLSKAYLSTASD